MYESSGDCSFRCLGTIGVVFVLIFCFWDPWLGGMRAAADAFKVVRQMIPKFPCAQFDFSC